MPPEGKSQKAKVKSVARGERVSLLGVGAFLWVRARVVLGSGR
jgi:hypothetical protein